MTPASHPATQSVIPAVLTATTRPSQFSSTDPAAPGGNTSRGTQTLHLEELVRPSRGTHRTRMLRSALREDIVNLHPKRALVLATLGSRWDRI